jgi:enamine deaminase RidA (YjgF/YER057c/UK114 family)
MFPDARLHDLNITLPTGSSPAGNYAPAVRSGNLLFLSGKAPLAIDGIKPKGKLGAEYSADDGYRLARSACLDLLAAIRKELGSLNRVEKFVELQGSLNTTPDFEAHAQVLDGASDLLAEIFGPAGIHARSVIGVASLRDNVPLTLRAVVEIKKKRGSSG